MSVELIEQSAQPVLAIRTRTRVQDLPGLIGTSYHRILGYMAEAGDTPAAAPYTAYFNLDMDDLDVEMGFPVSHAYDDRGDIRYHVLPAGRAVSALHTGPYARLPETYAEMNAFIGSNHLEAVGSAYEYYYTGPETPEDEHVTRVVLPVL